VTTVLNIVLLSLAALAALGALVFLFRGLGARSRINRQAYSVGQVEARRTTALNWIRAGFLAVAALSKKSIKKKEKSRKRIERENTKKK